MKPTIQCNKRLKDEHFHIILKIGKCTKYSSTFPDFNVWINAATSHTILRSPWSTVGVHQCYFLNVATLLQIASFHFGFIKSRAAASDTSCLVDKYNVTNMINGWMEGVQNKADAVLFLLDRNVVMISLLKADNWRISHFEPHSDRVKKYMFLRHVRAGRGSFAPTHLGELGLELCNFSLVYHLSVWHNGH